MDVVTGRLAPAGGKIVGPVVIAADKILADFARILLLLKGAESSLLPCQNSFISIFVTQKHISGLHYNAKKLFSKFPQTSKIHQAIAGNHHKSPDNLLATPGHTLATPKHAWQHLGSTTCQNQDQTLLSIQCRNGQNSNFPLFFRPNLGRLGQFRR